MGHTTWGWTGDEGRHAGVVVPYGGRGGAWSPRPTERFGGARQWVVPYAIRGEPFV